MIARAESLRALLVEDIARTAERFHRPAAAMLLRRFPDDPAVARAVAEDLRTASAGVARVAGSAAGYLADGTERAAATVLAEFCGLSRAEWIDATREEQGAAEVSL